MPWVPRRSSEDADATARPGSVVLDKLRSHVFRAESRSIAAALRGDRQAFDELVTSHRDDLFGFLNRRVAEEDVEDVVQDTWIAAWASLANFDRRCKFRTWLFAIAINKCRDYYRLRGQKSQRQRSAELVSTDLYVERAYDAAELQETLRAALDGMPVAQRQVLEMYYFSGLNLPEISNALGRNLNTVKYQFYRAHEDAARRLESATGLRAPMSSTAGALE